MALKVKSKALVFLMANIILAGLYLSLNRQSDKTKLFIFNDLLVLANTDRILKTLENPSGPVLQQSLIPQIKILFLPLIRGRSEQ